jgi:hypothetical protein
MPKNNHSVSVRQHRTIAPPPDALVQASARRNVNRSAEQNASRSKYDPTYLQSKNADGNGKGAHSNTLANDAALPSESCTSSILPDRYAKTKLGVDVVHDPLRMLIEEDLLQGKYFRMKGLDAGMKIVLDELHQEQHDQLSCFTSQDDAWKHKMEAVMLL